MSTMELFSGFARRTVEKAAVISNCGTYRYSLSRAWNQRLPRILFIGLNPSVADAHQDDRTIGRCIGFAKSFGGGSLWMANLFAYRATDPDEMKRSPHPVGEENDAWLVRLALAAHTVVFAWGTQGVHRARDKEVLELLSDAGLFLKHCSRTFHLGLTKEGYPRHPLYLKSDTPLTPWANTRELNHG